MNLDLKFTEANLDDVTEINKLLIQLFTIEKEFIVNQNQHKKALIQIIQNKKLGTILVLKDKNKIIAIATLLYTISTAWGEKVALLEDVIVDEHYRSRGIGNYFLTQIDIFVKTKQIKRLTLLTDDTNIIAQNLYKKQNFKRSDMIVYRKLL